MHTTIVIGAVVTASYAPIRCQNLEFSFKGAGPNRIYYQMTGIANNSPGGVARFDINAIGSLSYDSKLKVPIFIVTEVQSYSLVH